MPPSHCVIWHIRHWIFDLDGTLTVPQHDFAAIRQMLGIASGEDILSSLAAMPADLRQRAEHRLDRFEAELARTARPAEGARQLCEMLLGQGCRLAIVTRNSRESAGLALRAIGLEDCFSPAHIVAREDAQPKPSPAGLEKIIESWAVEPERVVMVGDHAMDVLAGQRAGCQTVRIHHESDADPPPELAFASLADLSSGFARAFSP